MLSSINKNREIIPEYDATLLWTVLILLSMGLVMVYSASISTAEASRYTGYQSTYFLMRHSIYLAIGILLGLIAFQFPMKFWQSWAPYMFMTGTLCLLLVFIPGLGREVNGSQRWIYLFGVSFQPSELMKLYVILYAADYTVRKAAYAHNFRKGFLPMLAVMLLVGSLLLQEPDFGAFAVITCVALSILFLGGMNWKLFAGLFVMLLIGFLLLIWSSPYRMQRIIGFMDPWADPFGKGYQLSHALIAFGRGEWLGVGLGASVEKLFYLPEAHTDFLLAVTAEELGFVGVIAIIFLFIYLVKKAFVIGQQAASYERNFSALVAQGIGIWLAVQTTINMGVNMGVLPTKGLTLPLLSFGGSGIIANCLAIAILLRIDWENRQFIRGNNI